LKRYGIASTVLAIEEDRPLTRLIDAAPQGDRYYVRLSCKSPQTMAEADGRLQALLVAATYV
jgi:hypothetical protein